MPEASDSPEKDTDSWAWSRTKIAGSFHLGSGVVALLATIFFNDVALRYILSGQFLSFAFVPVIDFDLRCFFLGALVLFFLAGGVAVTAAWTKNRKIIPSSYSQILLILPAPLILVSSCIIFSHVLTLKPNPHVQDILQSWFHLCCCVRPHRLCNPLICRSFTLHLQKLFERRS